jgi:hypothetical protein
MKYIKYIFKPFLENNFFSIDVCSIRLDFETFNLLGPLTTVEAATSVCQDTFKVTVSIFFTSRWAQCVRELILENNRLLIKTVRFINRWQLSTSPVDGAARAALFYNTALTTVMY